MVSIESVPWWLDICAFLGFAVILLAAGCAIKEFCEYVKYKIGCIKYKHRRKHRFDDPPLAECYCCDCEHWHKNYNDSTNGICWGFAAGNNTSDDCFCKYAKPRETDPGVEKSQ